MPIINLKKFYYADYTEETFIEVSDEVAEALLALRRQENNNIRKIWYHKAYFSLDCADGIENHALNWEQPSPEEILIRGEENLLYEITLGHLNEALSHLTPTQARRGRGRYVLNKKSDAERKERTHRLIERRAILETLFPKLVSSTGEEVKAFLSDISQLPEVQKLLKKEPEIRDTE